MEDLAMLKLLDRFEWLVIRNRKIEANRLVIREIENLKNITQQKCKLLKVSNKFCGVCCNVNCNSNRKDVIKF